MNNFFIKNRELTEKLGFSILTLMTLLTIIPIIGTVIYIIVQGAPADLNLQFEQFSANAFCTP